MSYTKTLENFLNSPSKKQKLIVIYGPTACGKTAMSLEVAKKVGWEIISADSRQIYTWMDIGTWKITKEEMTNIPHHMIDIVQPSEEYSVWAYKKEVLKTMKKIWGQWKIPILCWGTWLYLDAIVYNFQVPKVPADLKIRAKYEKMAEKYGKEFVFEKLQEIDPEYAKVIHANNLQYVIRGIEVKLLTGKSKLSFRKKKTLKYDTLFLTPYDDTKREALYQKINLRVQEMFDMWLVEEVAWLVKKFGKESPWLEAIGYSEVIQYLEWSYGLPECIEKVQQNSRNYAKRQVTWFRKYQ